MRQRLGVAGAICFDPQVLLLDEPTNGMDALGIGLLREITAEASSRECTVVVSSHYMTELEQLTNDMMLLSHGRVVFRGEMDEFAATSGTVEVAVLPEQVRAAEATLGRYLAKVDTVAGRLTVKGLSSHAVNQALIDHGVTAREVYVVATSLQERYIRWQGSQSDGEGDDPRWPS
jgi:ABC-2 type transport system ATP-binding protein